ncbi:hypothetical protein ACIRQQ_38795 [Streptomyces fuscichromogenes]|uniref:hypothetical protein n=1 Tax=Streptomyces fuscichromogenes TaxID=1324013 RepID=UPI00382D3D58
MARDFDDDAPRRIRDTDELVDARRRDAEERISVVNSNLVIGAQEKVARRRRLDRIWRAGWAVSWLSLLTAVIGTGIAAFASGAPERFVVGSCCPPRIRLRSAAGRDAGTPHGSDSKAGSGRLPLESEGPARWGRNGMHGVLRLGAAVALVL